MAHCGLSDTAHSQPSAPAAGAPFRCRPGPAGRVFRKGPCLAFFVYSDSRELTGLANAALVMEGARLPVKACNCSYCYVLGGLFPPRFEAAGRA